MKLWICVLSANALLCWMSGHMSFWGRSSFYLAILINILVGLNFPFINATRGLNQIDNFDFCLADSCYDCLNYYALIAISYINAVSIQKELKTFRCMVFNCGELPVKGSICWLRRVYLWVEIWEALYKCKVFYIGHAFKSSGFILGIRDWLSHRFTALLTIFCPS